MLIPLRLMLLPIVLFLFYWLMLLPISGRCYGHFLCNVVQMLLPTGRCYGHCRVVDGLWLMLLPQGRWYCHGPTFYFSLSSEMFSRTSSHMCGRWYLPTFLFRDGLLTLMYRASFIALLRLCSSLPTMLKFSTLMS